MKVTGGAPQRVVAGDFDILPALTDGASLAAQATEVVGAARMRD